MSQIASVHRYLGQIDDELPALVAILDDKGTLLEANRPWVEFAKTWNYIDEFQKDGIGYVSFCERHLHHCPDGSTPTNIGLAQVLAGEVEDFTSEYPCPFINGRWNRFVAKRIRGYGLAAVIVMHADVTDLMTALWDALKIRGRENADTVRKLNFIGAMSHEFRTPLNIIRGFAELVHKEVHGPLGDPRYGEYARHMDGASEALLGHVTSVLDLQKLELGTYELNIDRHDLRDVVDAVHTRLLPLFEEKRAAPLQVDLKAYTLFVDGTALEKIVFNLMENALVHGGPHVEIRVSSMVNEEGEIVLRVTDNGPGIPEDQVADLLLPFNRARTLDSEKPGRLGLGLPVAYRCARLHGGSLEVFKEVGGGTTVAVFLPKTVFGGQKLAVPA